MKKYLDKLTLPAVKYTVKIRFQPLRTLPLPPFPAHLPKTVAFPLHPPLRPLPRILSTLPAPRSVHTAHKLDTPVSPQLPPYQSPTHSFRHIGGWASVLTLQSHLPEVQNGTTSSALRRAGGTNSSLRLRPVETLAIATGLARASAAIHNGGLLRGRGGWPARRGYSLRRRPLTRERPWPRPGWRGRGA